MLILLNDSLTRLKHIIHINLCFSVEINDYYINIGLDSISHQYNDPLFAFFCYFLYYHAKKANIIFQMKQYKNNQNETIKTYLL